jgi:hypothetical protein
VGGAVAWPLAAAAQQSANKKRLAIFSPSELSADWHDQSGMKYARALFVELRRLGTSRDKIWRSKAMAESKTRPAPKPW